MDENKQPDDTQPDMPAVLPPMVKAVVDWVVGTILPALATAIGLLGPVWGTPTDKIQTTVSIIAACLGTIFNVRVHMAKPRS